LVFCFLFAATILAADPTQVAALVDECDTVAADVSTVLLRAQLAAAVEQEDYELVGALGVQLTAAPPLSDEDCLTLADRHEALVQKVITTCRELPKAKSYAEVKVLGTKLKELKVLDVSALPQSWADDPVYVPPATAPDACEEEWANDPVYVPPGTLTPGL
jgi:hypothetical protein